MDTDREKDQVLDKKNSNWQKKVGKARGWCDIYSLEYKFHFTDDITLNKVKAKKN